MTLKKGARLVPGLTARVRTGVETLPVRAGWNIDFLVNRPTIFQRKEVIHS